LAFAPDGKMLATASAEGTVKIWDAADFRERAALRGHKGAVWAVEFSPDGKTLATVAADRTAKVWEAASGKERHAIPGRAGAGLLWVAFAPDGTTLAAGEGYPFEISRAGAVRLFDPDTLKERAALEVAGGGAFAVAFAPDGATVVSGGNNGIVKC